MKIGSLKSLVLFLALYLLTGRVGFSGTDTVRFTLDSHFTFKETKESPVTNLQIEEQDSNLISHYEMPQSTVIPTPGSHNSKNKYLQKLPVLLYAKKKLSIKTTNFLLESFSANISPLLHILQI